VEPAVVRVVSESLFDKEWTLITNEDGSTAWDSVQEIQDAHKGIEASRIWTYCDGDDGKTLLVAGIHHVNAFAFAITEEPHDFLVEVVLDEAE